MMVCLLSLLACCVAVASFDCLFVASRCHLDIGLCAYMYSDVHFYGRRESEFQSGMNSYVDMDLFGSFFDNSHHESAKD